MELIMYEAFQVFKEEGVEYASLGVAPLAGLKEENASLMEKLLEFVYEHLNQCYGFKDLLPGKGEIQSYRLGTILLCVSAEDPFSGYVLCSGEDPEPTGYP